jgi:hypothetical protein
MEHPKRKNQSTVLNFLAPKLRKSLALPINYIYPQKRLPQFTLSSTKEDLELVILQNDRKIVKLPAKFPPLFPDIKK